MTKTTQARKPLYPLSVYEADAMDARQALRGGDIAVFTQYVGELESNLRVMGELLAPKDDQQQCLVFKSCRYPELDSAPQNVETPADEEEEDWEGSTQQLRTANALGEAEPIGWYFIDAADVLHELRRVLNPNGAEKSTWQLRFHRRRRGKPTDAGTRKLYKEIRLRMRLADRQFLKREAAIAQVCSDLDVSRSTVMRALAESKRRAPTSHKKQE
jgi:hypothetical protein